MSDGLTPPGFSEPVATDDAGAAGHVQIVKLAVSDDGSAVFLPATAADGMLVNLGTHNDVTLPGVTQTHDAVYAPAAMLMLGGVRRDTDTGSPVSADGDVHPFTFNSRGRLKVAAMPGLYTPTVGAITATAQSVSAVVDAASNVMMYVTGTFAGHNCTFEGSIDGGTSWFGLQAVRTNANTIETATGVLAAAPAYAWELSVNGLTNVRVRATAHVSGTATWRIQPGAYATEPIPAAQVTATQPISGSLTSAGTVTNTPATPTASIVNSAATTNGTIVKATAGTIYGIVASNTNAAARFLKLHNAATVTPGTTPVALTIPIPPAGVVSIDWGPLGMRFATGICLSITGAAGDSDTTAILANEVKVTTSFI
jgi:hypothetical protein